MGAFLSPKTSAPPPPPAPPTKDDTEVRQAALEERKRRQLAAGRAANIRTGGQGVPDAAPVAKKELLGE